jgi:hypothetical protein
MISEIVVYIVKVMLIQGIFYAFYRWILANRVHHAGNRYYLLCSLILSFVVPLLSNPFPNSGETLLETSRVMELIQEPVQMDGVIQDPNVAITLPEASNGWTEFLPWLYVLIALGFVGRSLFHLYLFHHVKKQSEYVSKQWFKLFKSRHSRPFSFFSDVFIPGNVFGTGAFDQILAHECVHVRQLHSLDRLLVDFLVSLFWFNPFIYWYRNALIEIHEYQADAEVISQYGDPIGYQEILFSQLQPVTHRGLVSHFNFSTIKKRIVMINKMNNQISGSRIFLLAVPLVMVVFFAFTSKTSEASLSEIAHKMEVVTGPFEKAKIPLVFQSPENIPSILPIKTDQKIRFTSEYGKRPDPFTKEIKWHSGIDMAIPIGTEILATAGGSVEMIAESTSGYGNMILLSHGEGYKTRYAQLSAIHVKKGDKVAKGQVIGLSGNSGRSTAPHLHYEVMKGDKKVNPIHYIKNHDLGQPLQPAIKSKSTGHSEEQEPPREQQRLAEIEMIEKEAREVEKELSEVEEERSVAELEHAELAELARLDEISDVARKVIIKEKAKIEAEQAQLIKEQIVQEGEEKVVIKEKIKKKEPKVKEKEKKKNKEKEK